MKQKNILEINNLQKIYHTKHGDLHALNGVSFNVKEKETLAIVGESGCGKSTLGKTLLKLHNATSGTVAYDDVNLMSLSYGEMKKKRKDIQMVFQDPLGSLNPRMTVQQILREPLKIYFNLKGEALKERISSLLMKVGLNPEYASRYPHEFSGGQRQRIAIARAIATHPRILVGDEPVSALDVSVQAQIINLLNDLKSDLGLTLILISHDLSVIKYMADRVIVMYLGEIVEIGTCHDIFTNAQHPYTKSLLDAVPVLNSTNRELALLKGEIPNPINLPQGCKFSPRCGFSTDKCSKSEPELRLVSDKNLNEHRSACFHMEELAKLQNTKKINPLSIGYLSRQKLYKSYSKA